MFLFRGSNEYPEYLKKLFLYELYSLYTNKINRASDIKKFKEQENLLIPQDINYNDLKGLRLEARQKLDKVKPLSIGQASRISGVSPADITILIMLIKNKK